MSTPQLPGIFGALAPLLNRYGYLAVGGLILVEDFGVPAPGETILIAAAVYAGAGQLNIAAVAAIGFAAAVAGDNIGFAIGRFGGRRLVLRYGRYVLLTAARLDKAEGFFTRHGGKVVTIARFVEGLRQANGIIAGLAKMHWAKFLAFNALGAALWVGLWTTLGYLAGNHIGPLYAKFHQYETYLGVLVAVLILAFIARRLANRHPHRGSSNSS